MTPGALPASRRLSGVIRFDTESPVLPHIGDPMRAVPAGLLLCLPLLTAASGCGFLFVHAPPTGHEQLEYIPCTESDAGPILDLVWGGLNVMGALIIASSPEEYENPDAATASGLIWGVISAFSA